MQQKHCIVHTQLTSYLISTANKEWPYYIFLHGWWCSASTFLPLLEKCEQDELNAVAIDLPGFWGSPLPSHTRTIHEYSKFLKDLLKKLDIHPTKIFLIGHSFWWRISIEYAAHTQIAGLILIWSAGIPPRLSRKSTFFGLLAYCIRPIFNIFGASRFYEARAKRLRSQDYTNAGALKNIFLQTIRYDQSPLLPAISAPTLLLRWEEDTETPLSDAKIMQAKIPNAKLITYPNAGHYVFLEETAKVYFEIKAFAHA